jgi:phospholipase C
LPSNLSNIKHIIVLTMENRSFDQMLGYLSLPVNAGGMGRKDVDGLKGGEFNFFNGTKYPSFPFAPGDTAFSPDSPHSYEPVFTQINADVHKPGSGKMDGFVKAFSEISGLAAGPRIMGYHTAVNVPVYDALARDFAISHRWFASHPGPTFSNRFYELTGRLNLASGLNSKIPENTWEFSNSSPLTPVFNKTIFDFLSDYQKRIEKAYTWKYYEQGYCFLRFFSKYTFDNTNIVSIADPANGFFADAKRGTLPSVSFIDPHFIELPPNANCDGPVADIKDGQAFVQKVVEAVVTSPQFANTLLIITYDEHGGFYDHVPPPPAVPFSDESPVKTYGVRVPAFFISPWVKAGGVFGHDGDTSNNSLYFDHTSILKTIARRFLTKDPPYMGRRYAAAKDLIPVLDTVFRRFTFLPFIRYNLMYNASQKMLDVQGANTAPGTLLWQWNKNGTPAQDFSIEEKHDVVYIRTHTGNLYLTVDVPDGATIPPVQGFGIKQDVKYEGGKALIDPKKFDSRYQLWKLTPTGTTVADKNMYVISSVAFPDRVLQPVNLAGAGALIVLAGKAGAGGLSNAWRITSPATSS